MPKFFATAARTDLDDCIHGVGYFIHKKCSLASQHCVHLPQRVRSSRWLWAKCRRFVTGAVHDHWLSSYCTKTSVNSANEMVVSRNLIHQLWHVTYLHNWLLYAVEIYRLKIFNSRNMFLLWVTFIDLFHNIVIVCAKFLKAGMSNMQKWVEEVLESNRTLFLCFSLCMLYILWQGQESVLAIVEVEFVHIFYFLCKFQVVLTFCICIDYFAEYLLFCCDLNCKWITCGSGCKRFWKQSSILHLLTHRTQGP